MTAKPAVLFVCLGNICRSPLAEAAFRREATRIGLDAGIDLAGALARRRAAGPPGARGGIAARRGHQRLPGTAGAAGGSPRFSHIVALDPQNLRDLRALKPKDATAAISLLLDHVPGREGEAVADPYYGGDEGFEGDLADATLGAQALARQLAERE